MIFDLVERWQLLRCVSFSTRGRRVLGFSCRICLGVGGADMIAWMGRQ